ncbi:hypothetical protein CAMRE0001_1260 [Campylobacter rectus RM3267]|uniref:Uncharacterized protein n=2 Tax=Campylobacter rectus TaxID=203 RepID=A0A6G5QKX2_CAMRE|nr:hypothetical protein [Campylobacter rectus]EEF14546.1 hypothetical protein CAMRE0001_1260 [Campylobacter rectus RM3267]QCD46373.1 hypothetical protein CRECT_0688 [Campylobacter rectus]UEB47077.1 hypothetical protein LK437_08680 [Campylobacter rectus]
MAEILIQILIVIFSVLLLGGIIWALIRRNTRKLSPRRLAAINEISETRAIKRLSVRPFLFWLERFFISCESLWFDQDFIYVFNGQKLAARYKFEQILAFEVTKIRINHARIWRIRFADGASEYKFAPAASIFTPNFKEFLQILREKNRGAIKTEPRFWETV